MHGRRPLVLLLMLLGLLAGAPQAPAQVQLSDEIGDFDAPMFVTSPPGDSRRLFVVEQSGVIRVVLDGTLLATPFLDIDADVQGGGEEGLLSMAFAPDYATSRRFYVYYTGNDGDNHLVEFQRSATDLDIADPSTRRELIEFFHEGQGNHNGGQLQFGPDGYLYIATGDGGGGNDTNANAQRLTGLPAEGSTANPLLGKMLRIDPAPSAGEPYTIPPDNPFAGSPGGVRPEIWAYGLRNPWRFSFDRLTGDLVIGDVGQGRAEEIDFAPASDGRGPGDNYGWPCFEGLQQNPGANPAVDCSPPPANVLPVLEQLQADGFEAIIGGYVVRDPSLGSLQGRYVYGDNSVDELRSVMLPDPGTDAGTGLTVSGLTSFGEDACGRVYAASFGAVRRIESTPPAGCSLPDPYPPGSDGGPGPGPGPGGAPTDTDPPDVAMSRRRVQRVLRQNGVILGVACDETCQVAARGTISVPGAARVFRLRRVNRALAASSRARIKLRLRRKTRRPLRRALRRGRRVRARINVLAQDLAGNSTSARRRVRARR